MLIHVPHDFFDFLDKGYIVNGVRVLDETFHQQLIVNRGHDQSEKVKDTRKMSQRNCADIFRHQFIVLEVGTQHKLTQPYGMGNFHEQHTETSIFGRWQTVAMQRVFPFESGHQVRIGRIVGNYNFFFI